MANRITKVTIVGVTGRVGSAFASALIAGGKHTVTGLTRLGSKSIAPTGIKVHQVDYSSSTSLIPLLTGQDFLVITLAGRAPHDTQETIVAAAIKAGVPWIMPNSYGFNLGSAALLKEVPGTETFKRFLELDLGGKMKWIAMSCGFWYQWSLAIGPQAFGFDIAGKKVVFYDDGSYKIPVATWDQCGRALASLLSLPISSDGISGDKKEVVLENWKNTQLYISSFKVSQRDMLESLHRVLGTTDEDWEIKYEDSEKRYTQGMEDMKSGNPMGFVRAMYSRVFYPNGDADFIASPGTANEVLGLPKEDLDAATKDAVEMVERGWNPFAG